MHDPALVKMALISRTFDEYMDADGRVRAYLAYVAAFDVPLDADRVRELHLECEAAKARWLEATK